MAGSAQPRSRLGRPDERKWLPSPVKTNQKQLPEHLFSYSDSLARLQPQPYLFQSHLGQARCSLTSGFCRTVKPSEISFGCEKESATFSKPKGLNLVREKTLTVLD